MDPGFRNPSWFSGDYISWSSAISDCRGSGYHLESIVDTVLEATISVRDGRAAFERDGVLFDKPSPEYAVLAALLRVSRQKSDVLRVLDFGGSLGTTFWRHRSWFVGLDLFRWDVVEQKGFVDAGRKSLENHQLKFFHSVAEAQSSCAHDVLLSSCCIQYLENPKEQLRTWISMGWDWIILNDLPLHPMEPDRLTIQKVPASIYAACYPAWFFNREHFLEIVTEKYEILDEFASEAYWRVDGKVYPSTGLFLRRKTP